MHFCFLVAPRLTWHTDMMEESENCIHHNHVIGIYRLQIKEVQKLERYEYVLFRFP